MTSLWWTRTVMSLFTFDEEELSSQFAHSGLDPEPHASPDHHASLNVPLRSRRRSSVYSRLSVKSSLPKSIQIPLGFGHDGDIPELPPHSEAKAKTLADFRPLKVLGQGAYGKVHLVQDRHNGKLYAQKQIRKPQVDLFDQSTSVDIGLDIPSLVPETASDDVKAAANHLHRTIAERRILSQITHHLNIVKLFYALQDDDKFYLLLEYIPGGELFHHLSSNNSLGNVFLEEHVAFYAAQMALGLRHLHQLGIVYRDLKPENCLLNSAGHLVLTDFGLSKAVSLDETDLCRLIIGTPEYMAPEIMKGQMYGYPVDWWLLGCVMYDMLTGNPPFTGKNHKAILDRIIKSKPNFPFYLSLDAKDLLAKLLQKNPTKRMAVDTKWDAFRSHRFFRKIDWPAVEAQTAPPPLCPVITDPALAENFSEEFTRMRISHFDLGEGQLTAPSSELSFKGFSFTASHSYIDRYKH